MIKFPRTIAVIDLGFGDSGKGITTSFICHKEIKNNPIVIRSNGGHQAGHTVVHNEFRHVFSQFGSGTLLGVPTYISKYCTIYPPSLLREYNLISGYNPILYVDPMTMVTTPFDIDYNRYLEDSRDAKHGSVGMGFGQTIERTEKHYALYFKDLFIENVLRAKLYNIATKYYKLEANQAIADIDLFVEKCQELIKYTWCKLLSYNEVCIKHPLVHIFESAQGVLLDQFHGFFPNVTRSNTTTKNIIELISRPLDEIYYVTRTYQTRHGVGFMTNTDKSVELKNNETETNKTHPYQGEFRTTELDPDLLVYSILTDKVYSDSEITENNLVVTCWDQLSINVPELVDYLIDKTNIRFQNIYISDGPSYTRIKNSNIIV